MEPTLIFDDDKEQAEYLARQKQEALETVSSEQPTEEKAPAKPRRKRTRRSAQKTEPLDTSTDSSDDSEPAEKEATPKPRRTRRSVKKAVSPDNTEVPASVENAVDANAVPAESVLSEKTDTEADAPSVLKPRRTRTSKKDVSSVEKPTRKTTKRTSKKANPSTEESISSVNEANSADTVSREKSESQQMSWGYFQELETSPSVSEHTEDNHDKEESKVESAQNHIAEPISISSMLLPSAEKPALDASPEKPALEEAVHTEAPLTPMLRPAVVDLLPARPFGMNIPVAVPENLEAESTKEESETSDIDEESNVQQRQPRRRRGHRGGKGRRKRNGNTSETQEKVNTEEFQTDSVPENVPDSEHSLDPNSLNTDEEKKSVDDDKPLFENEDKPDEPLADNPNPEETSEENSTDIDSRRRSRAARRKAARRKAVAEATASAPVENKAQKKLFISVLPGELVEVVIMEGDSIAEYYVEMVHQAKIRGNIYKGVITNIDPSLQAAFVNFGQSKNGFLQIDEVHPEYWLTYYEKDKSSKYPPIQKVMKVGQEVLVQVVKEPTGAKGAFLTTWVSLAGRFLVLTPGQEQIGISRKVEDGEERNRLRELLRNLDPGEGVGAIVRTVSAGTSRETLQKDLEYLKRVWQDIRNRAGSEKAPSLIYEEPNLARRSIRDYLSEDISEIWVDDSSIVDGIRETVEMLFPERADMVKVYDRQDESMWEHFNVLKQIEQIHSREVILPSGGRLVFDQTEALMAIDINSGKSYGKNNFESTAVRTNLEAAEEIARQLRLRDVGGQIVIDFIEMREQAKCQEVERTIHNAMRIDRARHDIAHMSSFGLMQIVRQRIGSSAISISQEPCPHCGGTGMRRNMEWQALQLLREMRTALVHASKVGQHEYVRMLEPELAAYILNSKRERLVALEKEFDIHIEIHTSVSDCSR